jgi:hypothetical protein
MVTLCVFLSLVWLREHILHGGGPEWLDVPPEVRLGRTRLVVEVF